MKIPSHLCTQLHEAVTAGQDSIHFSQLSQATVNAQDDKVCQLLAQLAICKRRIGIVATASIDLAGPVTTVSGDQMQASSPRSSYVDVSCRC